eukprot:TRINITY_DN602_c0_g1_i2.p1 TRINITY_DN602_c0_g1~~TRINITY_DN602_c0_g1_i2.p1  ORF type:complete len:393 (+),score=73.18 TRINITY_DN602_c0_g1_i2:249-1427(+)
MMAPIATLNPVLERSRSKLTLSRAGSKNDLFDHQVSLSRAGSRQQLLEAPLTFSRVGSMNERDGMLTLSRMGSRETLGSLDVSFDGMLPLSRTGSRNANQLGGQIDFGLMLGEPGEAPAVLSRVSSRDSAKGAPNLLSRMSSRDSNNLFFDDVFTDQNVPLSAGFTNQPHLHQQQTTTDVPTFQRTGSRGRVTKKLTRSASNELILGYCAPEPASVVQASVVHNSFEFLQLPDGFRNLGHCAPNQQHAWNPPSLPLQQHKKARNVSYDMSRSNSAEGCLRHSDDSVQLSHYDSFGSVENTALQSNSAPNVTQFDYQGQQPSFSFNTSSMALDSPKSDGPDPWEGKRVKMKKGKYAGRGALVKERVNKKYRVEIDGVNMKLEFYPTSFEHCPL